MVNSYTPNKISLFTLFILMVITQGIAFRILIIEKENEFLQVKQEAVHLKTELETALNHSVTATKMLAYLVEKELLSNDFDVVSRELISQNKFIDALQLVHGETIIKTYPLKGNELSIGYEVLKNSTHRKEAQKALERNELYFEGPFDLIQGGVGIVGRLPIFIDNTYWGFSAVIIRIETLLDVLGTDSTGMNDNYIYQLTKHEEIAGESILFFKDCEKYTGGIFYKSYVPIGEWNIYVKKRNPEYWIKAIPFSMLGMLFSMVFALGVYHITIQPKRLKMKVAEKTNDLTRLNEVLMKQTAELRSSNAELEQFAYVASHDLQEPLRMITGFLTQLEKKYKNVLDEKANQYIHFAVDGARRMQQIILDLLEYSRVGKNPDGLEKIVLGEIIEEVCQLQRKIIEEKRAVVRYENLPTIPFYRAPLTQVFQNLLGNAVKYGNEGVVPVITIEVKELDNEWQVSVKDNGIGIEPEYFSKIFIIFQRLHNKDQYAGTGMGLAIVKKIIENFRGRIWVESFPGNGSIFYFTLPKYYPPDNSSSFI